MSIESTIRIFTALLIFPLQATRFIFQPSPARERQYLALLVTQIAVVCRLKSDAPDSAFLCGFLTTLMSLRLLPTLTWEQPPDVADHRSTDPENRDIADQSTVDKFLWGFSWMTTLRGIPWNWRAKNVPPQPPYASRWDYLVKNVPVVFAYGCVLDVLWKMRVLFNFTKYHGGLEGYGSSASQGVGPMVVNSVFAIVSMYVTTVFNYQMMAVVAIAIGISGPEDWPPILGPVREAYSLRNFWARTWHQLFRNIFEKYGRALVFIFGFEQRGARAHNVTRFLAFVISGLIHAIPIAGMPFPRGIPKDKNTPYRGSDQMVFFIIHAILCFVEERFSIFYRSVRGDGPSRNFELFLGYIWVAACMVFTSRYLFDEMELSGINDKTEVVPWSIVAILEALLGQKLFDKRLSSR
ncbi:hypothetical protein TWF481_000017 [Arthrobotrys musiformis]|uniref:Wax synthase domain-containing protein n=1 Tax=Arthrobotrys musiformis TaxID=47236 RepID=A0AAV9WLC6_9PEZI